MSTTVSLYLYILLHVLLLHILLHVLLPICLIEFYYHNFISVDLNPAHTPYPVLVRAEFKQPLFMPNTAVLKYQPIDSLQADSLQVDDPVFDYCCNNQSRTIRYCVFSESKSSLPAGAGRGNQTPMSFNLNGFVTYQADI